MNGEERSRASAGPSSLVVAAQTAYPRSAPGPRVRIASLAPHLAPHSIDLRHEPLLTDREYAVIGSSRVSAARKSLALGRGALRTLRRPRNADLVLVHRLRMLAPVPGGEPLHRVDVYDFDDALFVGDTLPGHERFAWLKRERERFRAYASRARLVIAGNSYLAAHAATLAQRVEVIPSCVDPEVQPLHEHSERDVVRVGWIGTPSTSPYLKAVLPVFERLNSSRLRAKLVLVGSAAQEHLSAQWAEHRPWSLATERDELASFDIGIMPMPDTAWTRGKCGYKLLQYFSAGVPAVASPVGVNREIVSDETGALASTPDEWLGALEYLIGDAQARAELGRSARAFVERNYSYQRWAPEVASLLHEL